MEKKLTLKALFIASFTALVLLFGMTLSASADDNNALDKTVSMSEEFLAGKHAQNMGLECTDCHANDTSGEVDAQSVCLGCHEQADIEERGEKMIAKLDRNPHKGHYPDLSCNECHKGHEVSVNFCDSCHTH